MTSTSVTVIEIATATETVTTIGNGLITGIDLDYVFNLIKSISNKYIYLANIKIKTQFLIVSFIITMHIMKLRKENDVQRK